MAASIQANGRKRIGNRQLWQERAGDANRLPSNCFWMTTAERYNDNSSAGEFAKLIPRRLSYRNPLEILALR